MAFLAEQQRSIDSTVDGAQGGLATKTVARRLARVVLAPGLKFKGESGVGCL